MRDINGTGHLMNCLIFLKIQEKDNQLLNIWQNLANDILNKTVHSVKELFLEVDLCHRKLVLY